MYNIDKHLKEISTQVRDIRRHIHKHPETGWSEYATTAFIANFLQNMGYEVKLGSDAIYADSRLAPPNAQQCAEAKERALLQGANPEFINKMGDGLTGLWVDIVPEGQEQNTFNLPITALRFDIDAIGTTETKIENHIPNKENFASCNDECMHACGHDGHVAIGLGIALILHELRPHLKGIVRLIFQPAEEIGQGAKAMLDAGVVSGVNEIIGIHVGVQAKDVQTLICGTTDFLAVTSFELSYTGKAAHAGLAPQEGQNALMAALAAVQGMLSISRHGQGATRVNVGQLIVDGSPNIIPSKAWLAGETRGINSNIDQWMMGEVMRISKAAAEMWNCNYTFKQVGSCISGYSDESLAQEVYDIAQTMPCFKNIILSAKFMASEDFTWLLKDVQERGGQGTYIQVGVELSAGHHNECFDFDEGALMRSVELLARLIIKKLT